MPRPPAPDESAAEDGVSRKDKALQAIGAKLGADWQEHFVELNPQDWSVNAVEYLQSVVALRRQNRHHDAAFFKTLVRDVLTNEGVDLTNNGVDKVSGGIMKKVLEAYKEDYLDTGPAPPRSGSLKRRAASLPGAAGGLTTRSSPASKRLRMSLGTPRTPSAAPRPARMTSTALVPSDSPFHRRLEALENKTRAEVAAVIDGRMKDAAAIGQDAQTDLERAQARVAEHAAALMKAKEARDAVETKIASLPSSTPDALSTARAQVVKKQEALASIEALRAADVVAAGIDHLLAAQHNAIRGAQAEVTRVEAAVATAAALDQEQDKAQAAMKEERAKLRVAEALVRKKERDIDTLGIRREAFGLWGAMSKARPSVVDLIEENSDDDEEEEEEEEEPVDLDPDQAPEGGSQRTSGRGTTRQAAQRPITVST